MKAQMAFKLQDAVYKTDELSAFRQTLVDDMVRKVSELNQDNFAVKQHLKFVELYTKPNRYQSLSYEDTLMMQQELAPLLLPEPDDPKALRFDALLYGMELAHLAGLPYNRAHHDLLKRQMRSAKSPMCRKSRHNRHCWKNTAYRLCGKYGSG